MNMASATTSVVPADGDDYEETEAISSFDEMGLKDDLLRGIYAHGFKKPTAIQERAIIPIIEGHNVIAQGQSGAGKASMIAITVCQVVDTSIREVQALILSPTKDRAAQVEKLILAIGDYINIQAHACIGPISLGEDIRKLAYGVHAVSGTPARIWDLINSRVLRTGAIRLLLLDESDEIVSRGLKSLISGVYRFLPPDLQVVSISATLLNEQLQMTSKFMTEPVKILLKSTLEHIEQYFVAVERGDWMFDTLRGVLDIFNFSQAVIFCNTEQKVDWLTEKMRSNKFLVSAMDGDMPQMESDAIMSEFRNGTTRVLITSALGLHVQLQQVSLVINYDLPYTPELYIYRIGRRGVTVNLVKTEDMNILRDLEHYYTTHIRQLPMDVAHLICQ